MKNQTKTILAIECSTRACSVALRSGGETRLLRHAEGRNQAEAVVPLVAEVMTEAECDWDRLDAVAVSIGPGSFTGLRIGIAAARGLGLARGLPVLGHRTAEIMARKVPPEAARGRALIVAIDSRRDDVFFQRFADSGMALGDILAMTPAELLTEIPGPLLLAGDGLAGFADLTGDFTLLPINPDAAILAELAEQAWRDGKALPAEPLYVRPPDVSLPKS